MRIDNSTNKFSPSSKGLWNNKAVLKGLETISEHGTTFVALTTLAMAAGVRPIAINLTPKVKKENKQYAATNSIASGFVKFALVEAIAIPVENAIKQIDKTPEKFLSEKTIKTLQGNAKTLAESKDYKFITQVLKMGTNFITAIPKAMITVAIIPVLMDLLFKKKKEEKPTKLISSQHNPIFDTFYSDNKPSFKGALTTQTAKGIGKILNAENVQKFAKKFSVQDADIARNISMATDILLTASFVHRTHKSDKIKKERKTALIANNLISTGISLVGGFAIDNLIKKNTESFIKKFSEINKNNPKLPKNIEGINILRPTLIFAAIYYLVLPIFSTYISDKIDTFTNSNKE